MSSHAARLNKDMGTSRATLVRTSLIAALVPHFHCERWLEDCLASLIEQTRPPDAIVVIDDGSEDPPIEIVGRYSQVTLLASEENVGPYRLIQQVIDDTGYDGYLFQDADDWSGTDRLAELLAEAEKTGAELVGCQELLIPCHTAEVQTVRYPLDVNQHLQAQPGSFGLVHHASLVSRDLVRRTGGFATGLRFGGDAEFLQRAVHAARVRNVSRYCYFRRQREGSLTTDASTGLRSAERLNLADVLRMRAAADAAAKARGASLSLAPYLVAGPVRLTHVLGPKLRRSAGPPIAGGRQPAVH